MQKENPFIVETTAGGRLTVGCSLPLASFEGENARTAADELARALNETFNEVSSGLIGGTQEEGAGLARRKASRHMYLAVEAVLETQRDAGQGPVDWMDIYSHPDFRFPYVIGSALLGKPLDMRKVRGSIQGAVRYLQLKGVVIEATKIPGRGLCYSLC